MGRPSQPRDQRGRWTTSGRGATLGSQRPVFKDALQNRSYRGGDNDGRSTVYAYLRDKDSPRGKAGSPYYIGVAGDARRPFMAHRRVPVPSDERRIRMLRGDVTHQQAREWEKFYIARYGRQRIDSGGMLLNRTSGGEGVRGLSRRDLNRRRAATAAAMAKPEVRANVKAAAQLKGANPEFRAKMSASQKQRLKREGELERTLAQINTPAAIAKRASSREAASARKYGIDAEVYKSLSPGQRTVMRRRFNKGVRGPALLGGS